MSVGSPLGSLSPSPPHCPGLWEAQGGRSGFCAGFRCSEGRGTAGAAALPGAELCWFHRAQPLQQHPSCRGTSALPLAPGTFSRVQAEPGSLHSSCGGAGRDLPGWRAMSIPCSLLARAHPGAPSTELLTPGHSRAGILPVPSSALHSAPMPWKAVLRPYTTAAWPYCHSYSTQTF